jgi:hypothetical protein
MLLSQAEDGKGPKFGAFSSELVSLKNLDVLYTWSRDINTFKVKNIE